MLEQLRAQVARQKKSAPETGLRSLSDDETEAEAPTTEKNNRTRKRRRDGAIVVPETEQGGASAKRRNTNDGAITVPETEQEGASAKRRDAKPRGMSKVAYTKSGRSWIAKYNDGKCSAENCIKKLEALLDKYSPE